MASKKFSIFLHAGIGNRKDKKSEIIRIRYENPYFFSTFLQDLRSVVGRARGFKPKPKDEWYETWCRLELFFNLFFCTYIVHTFFLFDNFLNM